MHMSTVALLLKLIKRSWKEGKIMSIRGNFVRNRIAKGLSVIGLACALTASAHGLAHANSQIAEVQEKLSTWLLLDGPADGVWSPETEAALSTFLEHRGIEFDGEFGAEEYAEVMGQSDFDLPQATGLELCQPDGFPSKDTYVLSESDPSEFSLTLAKGDFDRTDYSSKVFVYDNSKQNWMRQRAEVVACEWLPPGQTYTLDFDVRVSDISAGTFFQIRSEDVEGVIGLGAFPGSLRVDAGATITMKATYRGEYLNEWMSVRVVFHPGSGEEMFFRFYVNGKPGFEASGNEARFVFSERGAELAFGPLRGKSSKTAQVAFRNIVLVEGDLGAP